METAHTINEIRRLIAEARSSGAKVGLVPTMGALHEGHMSLIDRAAAQCQFVVVSIFVNPTQFGPTEDLDAYPRTPEQDLALCREHGAHAVFMPSPAEMYPPGAVTRVSVPPLSDKLCGASRPGHFTGVCTVVAKLFNIVQPSAAYFGDKDYQQVAVLRRMVGDLDFPVEIVACPTVREADGLAMSSRNRYLTAQQRAQAGALWRCLEMAREMIVSSRPAPGELKQAIRQFLASHAPLGQIDYVKIADPEDLTDVTSTDRPVLVALAVKFGRARLIDHDVVNPA